jgi:hypothetical protein
MQSQSKLHSIKISKLAWKLILLNLAVIGVVIFSIANMTLPAEYVRRGWFAAIGGGLIGAAFGLVYARIFKIQGIDK